MNDIVSTLKEIIFERMRRKLVITVEKGENSSVRVSPDSFGGPLSGAAEEAYFWEKD